MTYRVVSHYLRPKERLPHPAQQHQLFSLHPQTPVSVLRVRQLAGTDNLKA